MTRKGFVNPEVIINPFQYISCLVYVITVSTDRTAAGLWPEKKSLGLTDSDLEAFILYSTKSPPKTTLQGGVEFLLFEGGQNLRPNLPNPITLFPDNILST